MPRNAASTLRRTQGLAPAAKHGLSISNARTETDPLRIVPVVTQVLSRDAGRCLVCKEASLYDAMRANRSSYSRASLISSSELSWQSLSDSSAVEDPPTDMPTRFREHSFPYPRPPPFSTYAIP